MNSRYKMSDHVGVMKDLRRKMEYGAISPDAFEDHAVMILLSALHDLGQYDLITAYLEGDE